MDFKLKTHLILADFKENIRELRNLETKKSNNLNQLLLKQRAAARNYSVISLYVIDGILLINTFDKILKTDIEFSDIVRKLDLILFNSKKVLKSKISTREDKAKWWLDRIDLDRRLGLLLKGVNPELKIENNHVILILDEKSTNFPWEYTAFLKDKHVFRLPSLEFFEERRFTIPVESLSWIIDTNENLKATQTRISNYLSTKSFKNNAEDYKVLLYFGHGGGSKFLGNIKNKILFLFGCCSSKILSVENFKRNGKALSHLERGNTVIGCLWEVTDKDLDLISMKIIDNLFSGKCIACIIKESFEVCKLKYLNGCSLVVYGLPTILSEVKNQI